MADDFLGHAPDQQVREPAPTLGGHDDGLGPVVACLWETRRAALVGTWKKS